MRCTPDAQNDACPTCDSLLLAESSPSESRIFTPPNVRFGEKRTLSRTRVSDARLSWGPKGPREPSL